ncbi:hypothetical protein A9Q81_13110 [Gammaproteobacteria bacterium 42_54_T18]|nr:hypothetical protein A9Q81_13110 [Gammaproteobacteria bacterium 42_54_T18]
MADAPNLLTAKILKKFTPLNRLNDKQLILLASHHEIKRYKKKAMVIELDSSDNKEYFLVQGKLLLTASDGKQNEIEGGTPAAMRPIAHLQPRQYNVKVLEAAIFLIIDWAVLAQFVREAPKDSSDVLEVQTAVSNEPTELIRSNFYQDLSNNQFNLPSIPVVANHIREAMTDEGFSTQDMTRLISADPAMMVKVISASNSPIYRGTSAIETCTDAVVRMGLATTKQLVDIYALRELFGSKLGKLQSRMQALWEHSQSVAVIAHTLAKLTGTVNPEQALLAGLTHDVGVIPVLLYAEGYAELIHDTALLDNVVDELRADMGKTMLTKWGWSDVMIDALVNAENWQYDSGSGGPNLTDIVIIAQVHAWLGAKDKPAHPPMGAIMAFSKLEKAGLTPEKSIAMLVEAKEQVEEVRRLVAVSA